MTKQHYRNQLFDAHTNDLQGFLTEPAQIVCCPICLRGYTRDAIVTGELTDGHVWPKDIRKGSKVAARMRVLLCRDCNGRASIGDQQMQLDENIRRGDEIGDLHLPRRVKLILENEAEPFELKQIYVKRGEDGSIHIRGRVHGEQKWLDGVPFEQSKLKEIHDKRIRVKFEVYNPREYKPDKVPAAWVIAAYLAAYYSLGYRYILDPNLQTVRDYILKSLDGFSGGQPTPSQETFQFGQFKSRTNYFRDPRVTLFFPLDGVGQVYLQVTYLRFVVRLPFWYSPEVMQVLLQNLPANSRAQLDQLEKQGIPFPMQVTCTKTLVHDCIFDYLMGKKPSASAGSERPPAPKD